MIYLQIFLAVLKRIFKELQNRLPARQYLVIMGIVCGILSGLATVCLKIAVYGVHGFIETMNESWRYGYLFFPLIGIILSVIYVKRFHPGVFEKGVPGVLYAIAKNKGKIPQEQIVTNSFTSVFTVGTGGSTGLESPIVSLGSAIGSNFAVFCGVKTSERSLLLASGAAAGIAAAFNTPIASVLFAVEVLLADISITAFIPVLVAAAAGALMAKIILNENLLISFSLEDSFNYQNVHFYLLLGVFCGLMSVYYASVFRKIESFFRPLSTNTKIIYGGIGLITLLFLFPPLFGEGYDSILLLGKLQAKKLFFNSPFAFLKTYSWGMPLFLAGILLLKVFATAFTVCAGGNGGNFAPSLFVGAFAGYFFSTVINLLGVGEISVINFTLVAMAGILSGIFHAPLSGIFLIAEMTGGYNLMIPLMIVSAVSFSISKYIMPMSMDKQKLADNSNIITTNSDSYLLSRMEVGQLLETDFHTLHPADNLGTIACAFENSTRNAFPIVSVTNKLLGVLYLNDLRPLLFKTEFYSQIKAIDIEHTNYTTIHEEDDFAIILEKFQQSSHWNLPVVDDNLDYKGFISKSSVLEQYREMLLVDKYD